MSVASVHKLENGFQKATSRFQIVQSTSDPLIFVTNINKLIQNLQKILQQVRQERDVFGKKLPGALLIHICEFLDFNESPRWNQVCKGWKLPLQNWIVPLTNQIFLPFFPGQTLDVLDEGIYPVSWRPARILQVKSTEIFIHYLFWEKKWDEWIQIGSSRLAPLGSHSKMVQKKFFTKKEFKINDRIWICTPSNSQHFHLARISSMNQNGPLIEIEVQIRGLSSECFTLPSPFIL